MCVLGYIYSNKNIKGINKYISLINDISDYNGDKPLLIIGLENARKYSAKFSILNKRISQNVFWTFDKSENREDYDNDINKFHKFVISNISSQIKYYYVNFIGISLKRIKHFINMMNDNTMKYAYINNSMAYIMYGSDVFGISFDILDYCGISRDKIIDKIIKNKKIRIQFENKEIRDKIKYEYNGNNKIIPYLISQINEYRN